MEAQNVTNQFIEEIKGGLSVIILRVRASDLFNKDNPSDLEIKNACCVVDVLNDTSACNEGIAGFETPVQPKSWVVWHGMLKEEEGSDLYDISLDFVMIKKPASKIFNNVIYYQNGGTIMAKTKNNLAKGDKEPYDITFTLTKWDEERLNVIGKKTYVLDPWVLVK